MRDWLFNSMEFVRDGDLKLNIYIIIIILFYILFYIYILLEPFIYEHSNSVMLVKWNKLQEIVVLNRCIFNILKLCIVYCVSV